MKHILLAASLLLTLNASLAGEKGRTKEKIVCAITVEDADLFFSVYEKGSDKLLVGYAGEPIATADDEFQLRLQNEDNGILTFKPNHLNDYPGYFDLRLDTEIMLQTGTLVSEGTEMSVMGNCARL